MAKRKMIACFVGPVWYFRQRLEQLKDKKQKKAEQRLIAANKHIR